MQVVKGCLIDNFEKGNVNIIAHQVNCQGVMASGIAKTIRSSYPEHFSDYLDVYKMYNDKSYLLGLTVNTILENKIIIGLFSQYQYGYNGGRFTNYSALSEALMNAGKFGVGPRTIGVPYNLGCDRGGGDWNIVEQLLIDTEKRFNNLEIIVFKKF